MDDILTNAIQNIDEPSPPSTLPEAGTGVFANAARSGYGDMAITKYLTESGLQNIFNLYQKNIEILSQNQQRELQDAYFMKEISKKYLGEYASNAGIGDVSGNLIDVYGQYQKNLNEINRNYEGLNLGLQQQYQQQRFEHISQIMLAQYGMEVGRLAENAQTVLSNILAGETGDLDELDYLAQALETGAIDQQSFNVIRQALQDEAYEDFESRSHNGFFGFVTDEDGIERGRTATEYLESVRPRLGERNYERAVETAEIYDRINSMLETRPINIPHMNGEPNPDYVGENFNWDVIFGGDADSSGYAFVDANGIRWATAKKTADQEKDYDITQADINLEHYDETGNRMPVNNARIAMNVEGKGNVEYIFRNGNWHRLIREQNSTDAERAHWYIPEDQKKIETTNFSAAEDGLFGLSWLGRTGNARLGKDDFVIGGVKYEQAMSGKMEWEDVPEEIQAEFRRMHQVGDHIRNRSVILAPDGKLYYHKQGKVYHLRKRNLQ